VGEQHLGSPEKQVAVVVERVVEPGQNPTLRLGGEVDERVPADEQIEPRDRRVLGEVVAPEDDGPPKGGAKDEALPLAVEIPFADVGVDGGDLLGGVARASLAECLLVDVGGVDLDAVEVALLAEGMAEKDRRGVRLLARR